MVETNKPIMPTFRAMKVGDVESFPVERIESVRVTVRRYMDIHKRQKAVLKTRIEGLEIKVSRIS